KIPEDFNVFRLIQEMRTQRHSAVQTKIALNTTLFYVEAVAERRFTQSLHF
ncbi:hypothetical protein CHARACLAT_032041, partial [Characodon lateralis]|nr:hypothetical protein [Characodon lateralis]